MASTFDIGMKDSQRSKLDVIIHGIVAQCSHSFVSVCEYLKFRRRMFLTRRDIRLGGKAVFIDVQLGLWT